jgi:hypothetical protein
VGDTEAPPRGIELVRVAVHDAGAFGVLLQDGLPFALSLERTFGDEVVIPPGEYPCRRTTFHRGQYKTWEIIVPGHDRVLFHIGNVENDSRGCVLVGLQFGKVDGQPGVLLSRLGFLEFMRRTPRGRQFQLTVREA